MDRVGGVPGVTLAPGISRSQARRPFRSAAPVEAAGRTGTGVSRLSAKPRRPAAPCVSRRAHNLGRGILARSLFRYRHTLATICGNTGRPVGRGRHGAARLPGVEFARSAHCGAACSKIPTLLTTSLRDRFPRYAAAPSRARSAYRKPAESARGGAIHVAPERAQAAVKAPEIKLKGPARPDLAASSVPPEMPIAATSRSLRLPAAGRSDHDRCAAARDQPGDSPAARSAAGFRRCPGPRTGSRFLPTSRGRARCDRGCARAGGAGRGAKTRRHQHRPERGGRTRAALAGGRAEHDFGRARGHSG